MQKLVQHSNRLPNRTECNGNRGKKKNAENNYSEAQIMSKKGRIQNGR